MTKRKQTIQLMIPLLFLFFCFLSMKVYVYADELGTISCTIVDQNTITIQGTVPTKPLDGKLYLFELQPYEDEDGIDGKKPIAETAMGSTFEYEIPLLNARLTHKFVVGQVDKVGQYECVTQTVYPQNPEALAKYTDPFPIASSKKGLLVNHSMISDALDLGIKHSLLNINIGELLTDGDVPISYQGQTYYIHSGRLAGYDRFLKQLSEKGVINTAVILATPTPNYPQLVLSEGDGANYQSLNMQSQEGIDCVMAVMHFLADRYTREDQMYGRISNWIVGNEVNHPEEWNGRGNYSDMTYIKNYSDTLRMIHYAVTSVYQNARVYASFDHCWDTTIGGRINAKEMINTMNFYIKQNGDFDWGIAYHPYPNNLLDPATWNDPVPFEETTDVISMKNISVLTDYLQKEELRNVDGSMKHVILSEVGFNSAGSNQELLQAAAFAYAYYQAESNSAIDALLLNRQVDHSIEATQGLTFGIWNTDGNIPGEHATSQKYIHEVFKLIDTDTETSLKITAFALPIIGIDTWESVIHSCVYPQDDYCVKEKQFSQMISFDAAPNLEQERIVSAASDLTEKEDDTVEKKETVPSSENQGFHITDINVSQVSGAGYQVTASYESEKEVSEVWFPTWTKENGQDDLVWIQGTVNRDKKTVSCSIATADHDQEQGIYVTHIYLYDDTHAFSLAGTEVFLGMSSLYNLAISHVSEEGYQVTASYQSEEEIRDVWFPTWTKKNGQDDLVWIQGTVNRDKKTVSCSIATADHEQEQGHYITHIYLFDQTGNYALLGIDVFVGFHPIIENQVELVTKQGYFVTGNCHTEDIKSVWFATWTKENGQDDLVWKQGNVNKETNTISCAIDTKEHNYETGTYITHIYVYDSYGRVTLNEIRVPVPEKISSL